MEEDFAVRERDRKIRMIYQSFLRLLRMITGTIVVIMNYTSVTTVVMLSVVIVLYVMLQPLNVCLRKILKYGGLLDDEKQWADRAILDTKQLQNVVTQIETLIYSTIASGMCCNDLTGRIYSSLNECLAPIDQEVKIFKCPSAFVTIPNSLLSNALKVISQKNALESPYWRSFYLMTINALSSFRHLYRVLVPISTRPTEYLKNSHLYQVLKPSEIKEILHEAILLCNFNTDSINETTTINFNLTGDNNLKFFKLKVNCHESITFRRTTLLNMPKAILVPGGRFREAYYWDTYWIIRGLCCAGKTMDAENMLINFFSCVDRFGFVPNGFRTYYLDRSQPPLLCECVKVVYESMVSLNQIDQAMNLLYQAFPRLLIEYFGFWMNPSTGHIISMKKKGRSFLMDQDLCNTSGITDSQEKQTFANSTHSILRNDAASCGSTLFDQLSLHKVLKSILSGSHLIDHSEYLVSTMDEEASCGYLNRFFSPLTKPRFESQMKDEEVVTDINHVLQCHPERIATQSSESVMQCTRAAAESGWDFSSRWAKNFITGEESEEENEVFSVNAEMSKERNIFKDKKMGYFRQIDTLNVVPVDLNAILYRYEMNLKSFAGILATDNWKNLLKNENKNNYESEKHNIQSNDLKDYSNDFRKLGVVFELLAKQRRLTMKKFMWDVKENVWRDYYLRSHSQSKVISVASVVALWAGLSDDEVIPVDVHPSLFKFWSVVPTKNLTGQQWDAPNVWPPLLHFVIEYLDRARGHWGFNDITKSGSNSAMKYFKSRKTTDIGKTQLGKMSNHICHHHIEKGRELASAFLLAAFENSVSCQVGIEGAFFEKYNALDRRQGGGGGEYPNQIGFGWTNGVIIELISRYQDSIIVPDTYQTGKYPYSTHLAQRRVRLRSC